MFQSWKSRLRRAQRRPGWRRYLRNQRWWQRQGAYYRRELSSGLSLYSNLSRSLSFVGRTNPRGGYQPGRFAQVFSQRNLNRAWNGL